MASTTEPQHQPDHDRNEHGAKRRRSQEPDDAIDSKRQRTSPGKNSPTATRDDAAGEKDSTEIPTDEQKPDNVGDTRRKSSAVDEKQRSKRLFGALLGNLRQPGDRTSKRRQEIESRRKAELQQQDHERLEDRQRRQEQLAEQRKITQVKVDEQNMHRRHRAMLDKANFLQTESEPRLFYRPWELRDDEEDRIEDQIKDAQDAIDREVAAFDERHKRDGIPPNGTETHEADTKHEDPRVDDSAKSEIDTTASDGRDGTGQDQASAKSDHGEQASPADAPDPTPATDAETANGGALEDSKLHRDVEGAEDEGGAGDEGDEAAVIY